MDVRTALICGALGLVAGSIVPSMIAGLPEPEPDAEEDAGDFPDKVLYSDLAERNGLGWKCSLACGIAAAVLGGAIGWHWGLLWLLVLVPFGCALSVVDFVTWYLPRQLVNPAFGLVGACELFAAFRMHNFHVVVLAVIGFIALGGYYGLMYLISPRMMAYGDVRVGALLGLALAPGPYGNGSLGVACLVLSVFAAAVVAVIGWMPLRALGNEIRRHIPFGPFLFVGAWLSVLLALWISTLVVT